MEATFEALQERPVLGVRRRVRVGEIGERIAELMPELMAVAGPHVAGPVLARWHGWEGDQGEMELAVPVHSPREGSGSVKGSRLPGGRALVVVHVGPYSRLHETWRSVGAWMQAQGHVGRDAPWEEYLDDCETTPEESLRTRIVWPVV